MRHLIKIPTLRDVPPAVKEILNKYPSERIFVFYGEMGAGKTTLIKEICRQLGVKESEMSSPTFALINEYRSAGGLPVFHFDFYRIKDETEVFDLGYEDYFYGGNYCFIEWPEKIPNLLPKDCVKVQIIVERRKRKVIIQPPQRVRSRCIMP